MKPRIYVLLFAIATAADLASVQFGLDIEWYVKPLLVPLLLGYYYSLTERRYGSFVRALGFCWAGDTLLLFAGRDQVFFITGLLAFLVAHVLLILTYRRMNATTTQGQGLLPTQKARIAFPVILAGTGLLVILFPTLGNLKIPVIVYASILTLMVLQALYRSGHTNASSFRFVLSGALLFMLSDAVLALNKFGHGFTGAGVVIMSTYCGALLLLVMGVVRHDREVSLL